MIHPLKLVFSNPKYLVLTSVIFVVMMIGLLIMSEYIFLEPYVVSHIPSGTELGFVLIVIISALSASSSSDEHISDKYSQKLKTKNGWWCFWFYNWCSSWGL